MKEDQALRPRRMPAAARTMATIAAAWRGRIGLPNTKAEQKAG